VSVTATGETLLVQSADRQIRFRTLSSNIMSFM
jgi:hypothetical protein